MQIKVYDISLVNYYLKNGKELDSAIDLQGFHPSHESTFINTEPPIVKHTKVFDFDYITQKESGVFIVEVIGGGILSRGIIKKGCLTCLERVTLSGHSYTILDEQ